jgi:hypothetical protein
MLAREGAPPGREAAAGGGSLVEELRRRGRAEEVSGERLRVGRPFFFYLDLEEAVPDRGGEFYFLPCFTLPLYNLPLFTFTSTFYHSLLCLFIICPFDLFLFRLRI